MTSILTNEKGQPFRRPDRKDLDSDVSWIRAVHDFNDRIAAEANKSFSNTFRKNIKAGK